MANEGIREMILAGKTMAAITEAIKFGRIRTSLSTAGVRELRDEIMAELNASPGNVKALAAGPLLNACDIVKYKGRPRKFSPPPVQLSILDIVDGHMGRSA